MKKIKNSELLQAINGGMPRIWHNPKTNTSYYSDGVRTETWKDGKLVASGRWIG